MEINIESPHFTVDEKLKAQLIHKLESLEKEFDRFDGCDVMLKKEKNDRQLDCIAEIKILVPQKILFAKAQAVSFEKAIRDAIDEIKAQTGKHREKLERH